MANHKSSEKRIRTTARRTEVNTARRSRVRTFIKKVEAACLAGDASAAEIALREAQPEMLRGVARGVFSLRTVSRKLSRLSSRIKALKTA